MPNFPHGFTLTVRRSPDPATDRFGNPYPKTSHTVEGCAAAPAGSTEVVNGQATVIEKDTVYGPYDADVTSQDQVEIPAGQPVEAGTYDVEGKPQRYKNPFTAWEAGAVIRLTRADGAE